MANRFFVNGGVDNNWGTSGNWSTTSGGAGGAAVPTSSDDVFFDGSSPNCTINASARVGLSINFTGYTNTITFSQQLTITTHITLDAGMTFAGSSLFIQSGTGTITSNGKAFSVPFRFSGGTATTTLADDMTVTAALSTAITGGTNRTINGNTLHIQGDFTCTTGAVPTTSGTTTLLFDGTGTWSDAGGATGTVIRNALTINTAGTLTISGTVNFGAATMTYTTGTVVTTGSTLRLSQTSGTYNTNGITWNNVTFVPAAGVTYALSSNMTVSGTLTLTPTAGTTLTLNTSSFVITGSLSIGGSAASVINGTTTIQMTGTGTWSGGNTATLRLSMTINTAGTITISGQVNYSAGTLTYTAGTVAGASTPFINITNGTATVFDLGGLDLGSIGLQINTAGVILNLASGLEIGAAGSLTLIGTAASPVGIRSNSTPTQRALTVQAGATIDIGYCNFTDIENSAGAEVHVFKGTISNSLNFTQFTPYTAPFTTSGGGEHSMVF